MGLVKLENINKNYGENKIIQDLSLEINEGEMLAIKGESGSGKSTLLNIIGLIESIDSGRYIIDNEENIKVNSKKSTKVLREKINYLFQNFALIDEESVLENLLIGLKYVKISNKEKLERIDNALEQVGLRGYENRKIYELSGGEQQRISIARCILKPCKMILADEPTGSLDKENVMLILELLKKLNSEGKTIVIVTHDDFVSSQCSRVLELKKIK